MHANVQLSTMINIIALLARTAWLFEPFVAVLSSVEPSVTVLIRAIADKVYAKKDGVELLERRIETDIQKVLHPDSPTDPPQPQEKRATQMSQYWGMATLTSASQAAEDKPASPPPVDPIFKTWIDELAITIADLTSALCWYPGDQGIW
jgi:hypothetical protein